jgi:hypothetical protein
MNHHPPPKPSTPETNALIMVALGYGAIVFVLYKAPDIPVVGDFVTFLSYAIQDHRDVLAAFHINLTEMHADPRLIASLIMALPFLVVGLCFTAKLAILFDGQMDQRAERMSKRREKQRQRKQGRDNFVVRVP